MLRGWEEEEEERRGAFFEGAGRAFKRKFTQTKAHAIAHEIADTKDCSSALGFVETEGMAKVRLALCMLALMSHSQHSFSLLSLWLSSVFQRVSGVRFAPGD